MPRRATREKPTDVYVGGHRLLAGGTWCVLLTALVGTTLAETAFAEAPLAETTFVEQTFVATRTCRHLKSVGG